jgi:hypothetical protein
MLNVPGQIAKVTELMGKLKVQIRDIKMVASDEPWIQAKFFVRLPHGMTYESLLAKLSRIEGVTINLD